MQVLLVGDFTYSGKRFHDWQPLQLIMLLSGCYDNAAPKV